MNNFLSIFMLISLPSLPLFLAFSSLRSRFSRPCLFALLPAIVLVVVPVDFSVEIPWLLLGFGLGIDDISRVFLAMSVILWIAALTYLHKPSEQPASYRLTTFILLTMAGNFGLILSIDLVSFFTFSTLMGYGFYGLLVDGGDVTARRAGRIYLGFMILADLVLFEALLIAAATTDDLSFAAVQQAMPVSSSSGLYLSIVLIGFATKAGFWPLHFWLPLAFRSSRPAIALLIAGIPIAMGLLGTLRWLPLGEINSPVLGLIIKSMGVVAMLYAILFAMMQAQLKTLPAYIIVFFTGLYAVVLGTGLTEPAVWRQYEYLAHFFIVLMAIGLSVMVTIIGWLQTKYHYPVVYEKQTDKLNLRVKRLTEKVVNWFATMITEIFPKMRAAWLTKADSLWHTVWWKKTLASSERFLQSWTIAITLFLLLGLIVVFTSASSWIR
ncbi:MAG: proton-conducting transporter membrane subunit [Gammaproteobacteria bacterium]|nr:proton-conducting transporter membrane subunit [Gammaproteobacteria bacterium]